jgi:hypothetical protein
MGAVEKLTLVKIILFELGKTSNNNRRPRWGTVKSRSKISAEGTGFTSVFGLFKTRPIFLI